MDGHFNHNIVIAKKAGTCSGLAQFIDLNELKTAKELRIE